MLALEWLKNAHGIMEKLEANVRDRKSGSAGMPRP